MGIIEPAKSAEMQTFIRKELKRNDRIVWWIKWYRAFKLSDAIKNNTNVKLPGDTDEIVSARDNKVFKSQKMLDKAMPGEPSWQEYHARAFNRYFGYNTPQLDHYITMMAQLPEMDKVTWDSGFLPVEMATTLDEIESEWQKATDQEIDVDKYNDEEYEGRSPWTKLIDYGDQAWVLIDKDYCDLEGKAMGHCGNNQGGDGDDRILSFRTIVNEKRHKPHLTFIIDEDGRLGEMKGRSNQKPNEKYHKVIVDLLLHDMVTGLKGGGHDPSNNFSMNDLEKDDRDSIFETKPELAGLKYKVEKGIALETDFMEMADIFSGNLYVENFDFSVDLSTNTVTLGSFDTAADIAAWANDYSFNTLHMLAGVVDEGFTEVDGFEQDEDELKEIVAELDREWLMALEEYVKQHMEDPDYYNEDYLVSIITENESLDDVFDALTSGHRSGLESGTYGEMDEAFDSALRRNGIMWDRNNEHYEWRTTTEEAIDLFDAFSEEEYYDTAEQVTDALQLRDADEARYGYHGFHLDSGVERFVDELREIDALNDIHERIESEQNESVDRMKALAGIK